MSYAPRATSPWNGFARLQRERARLPPRRRPAATALACEMLERREVLSAAPSDPITFQVTLTNNTGLDPTQYDVYAIGLATTGSIAGRGTYLGSDGNWHPSPVAANGTVQGVKFTTTPLTINLQSETKVIGGRFYTVVVPKGDVPFIPTQSSGTSYTPPSTPAITGGVSSFYWSQWNGKANTPIPGSGSWLYSAGEFTKDPTTGSDGKLTIDLSNVDFWSFPGYQSSVAGASLTPAVTEIGQPSPMPFSRQDVFDAWTKFVYAEKASGNVDATAAGEYAGLLPTSPTIDASPQMLTSAFSFLGSAAELTNSTSALSNRWNDTVDYVFSHTVHMYGDSGKSYVGKPKTDGQNRHLDFYEDKTPLGSVYCTIPSPRNTAYVGQYNVGYQVLGATQAFKQGISLGAGVKNDADALGLGRDIAQALVRGVAKQGYTPGTKGSNTKAWANMTNWYPAATAADASPYDLYARFWHVATAGKQNTPISIQPPGAIKDAQNVTMGAAYGFSQDENPGHVGQTGLGNQAQVPSELAGLVPGATPIQVTYTLLPWNASSPTDPRVVASRFTVPENTTVDPSHVTGTLKWSSNAFVNFDAAQPLTATLNVLAGKVIADASTSGVTVTGSGTSTGTFVGLPAALNGYFRTAGKIGFAPAPGSTTTVSYTLDASNAVPQSGFGSGQIFITPDTNGPSVDLRPGVFQTSVNTPVKLAFLGSPFADSDAPAPATQFVVTMQLAAGAGNGSLSAASGGGVTVGGTATRPTFTGTLTNLNAYFAPGSGTASITYTPPQGVSGTRTIQTTLYDPVTTKQSTPATTTIIIGANTPGTVRVPNAYWVTPGGAVNLKWPRGLAPFADPDSRGQALTVTLTTSGGTGSMTATGTAAVRVARIAGGMTFTGTLAALNAYFMAAGKIWYRATGTSLLPSVLTVALSDGGPAGTGTSAILVRPASPLSRTTIKAATSAGTTSRNQPLVITYADLVARSAAGQTGSRSIEFVLDGAPLSGRLEYFDGQWTKVPAVLPTGFKLPLLAPGGKIRWTPPLSRTGTVAAFKIQTWDGTSPMSIASTVSVNVIA